MKNKTNNNWIKTDIEENDGCVTIIVAILLVIVALALIDKL